LKEVLLPEFGDGVDEVTINAWHFEEGDAVSVGDNLVEVICDKGTFQVTAPASGLLDEVFFEEGDDVQLGEVIATIEPD